MGLPILWFFCAPRLRMNRLYAGSDFEYLAAELWFLNLDKLIKAVNQDGRVNAIYSTPLDYAQAKLKEVGSQLPPKTDDIFPYANTDSSFWTGYFTSRPALKRYIRQMSTYWSASRHVQAMCGIPTGLVFRSCGDWS
jgi:hypothetical protein